MRMLTIIGGVLMLLTGIFCFYQPGTDIPGDRVCHRTGDGSEWSDPHLRVYDGKRLEQQG